MQMVKGPAAIVVGASSGLGRAFALELDKQEDFSFFILIARREELLEALKNTLSKPAVIFAGDITSLDFLYKVLAYLQEELIQVQYLIVSAGVGQAGLVEDLADMNANMVSVNCLALTRINTLVLPFMKTGSGIINVSSVAALMPQHKFATYAATKAYVLEYTRALHSELKSRGIGVLACMPNPMETDFFRNEAKNKVAGSVSGIKRLAIEEPQHVAKVALRKLKRGKDISLSNFPAYLLLIISKILPHKLILWFERRFTS